MTNLVETQNKAFQNGRSPHEEVFAEKNASSGNSYNPDEFSTSPKSNALTLTHNEWSSITKDLVDSVPRVWTRGLLYFIVVFAAIALPWATLAKVDETGSARGRIEPKGAARRLDSPVSGTVATVKVKEGQIVKAKQVLVELESDVLRNELQQSQTKLEGQLNRLAQLELLKNQLEIAIQAQKQQNQAQELEKLAQVDQAEQNLDAKQTTYNLQKIEKLTQVDRSRQTLSSSQATYSLADIRFSRDSKEVKRYRKLWQEGVVAETKAIEIEKFLDESQRSRVQAQSDIKQAKLQLQEELNRYQSIIHQAQSDIKQAQLRLKEQQNSYQSLIQAGKLALLKSEEQLNELQSQITAVQTEISQNRSQIQSLKFQLEQRVIRSPIDGTVFHFPISHAGVVVQPGDAIAQIAPQEAGIIFKAQMPVSESGFLRKGMAVKLKFDAYPFQDYGVVSGTLQWISPDSKVLDTPQGKVEVFELEIALQQMTIKNQRNRVALTHGQTATAEVVVRQRRIIDFVLDPFQKLRQGGLEL